MHFQNGCVSEKHSQSQRRWPLMTASHMYVVTQVSGDLESHSWDSRSDGASQHAWDHQ